MQLNEEQQSQVAQWVADGADLAEVQKRLKDELGISMTYMDTRFLVDDLKLTLADKEVDEPETPVEDASAAPVPGQAPTQPSANPAPIDSMAPPADGGNVSVAIDQITRPDAMISGGVTFSDGVAAKWSIDQMGRLALDADKPDYRPSAVDVAAFQEELRKLAQSQGL